jgi:hypothetical protein
VARIAWPGSRNSIGCFRASASAECPDWAGIVITAINSGAASDSKAGDCAAIF